jgi:hypothetical protein
MNDYNPIFRSPITPVSSPAATSSHLSVADLTCVPVILLQGEVGELLKQHFAQIPGKPGDLVGINGGVLARLTPVTFGCSDRRQPG